MDTLAIIKRIEIKLAELGIDKKTFYREANISSASYSQWNTGKYNPSKSALSKIATYLGVSLDYLLGAEQQKTPSAGETDEERELNEYLEYLRTRPECRMLMRTVKGATKAEVEENVKFIEALRKCKSQDD